MSEARMKRLVDRLDEKNKEIEHLRNIIKAVLDLPSVKKMQEMENKIKSLEEKLNDTRPVFSGILG